MNQKWILQIWFELKKINKTTILAVVFEKKKTTLAVVFETKTGFAETGSEKETMSCTHLSEITPPK